MAISLVQTAKKNGGNYVTSTTLSFASNVAAGSLIVLFIGSGADAGSAIASVTDNRGNTYSKIQDGTNGVKGEMWYAKNAAAGATTITISFTSNYHDISVIAREYSGIDTTAPLDKQQEANDSDWLQSHSSGATPTTSQADELVLGAYVGDANSTYTAGSGYGNLTSQNGYDAWTSIAMEDKTVSATGAQTATFGSAEWLKGYCCAATFKASAGGTPATVAIAADSITLSDPGMTATGQASKALTADSVTITDPAVTATGQATTTIGADSVTVSDPTMSAVAEVITAIGADSVSVSDPAMSANGAAVAMMGGDSVSLSDGTMTVSAPANASVAVDSVSVTDPAVSVTGAAVVSLGVNTIAAIDPAVSASGAALTAMAADEVNMTDPTMTTRVDSPGVVELGTDSIIVTAPVLSAIGEALTAILADSVTVTDNAVNPRGEARAEMAGDSITVSDPLLGWINSAVAMIDCDSITVSDPVWSVIYTMRGKVFFASKRKNGLFASGSQPATFASEPAAADTRVRSFGSRERKTNFSAKAKTSSFKS